MNSEEFLELCDKNFSSELNLVGKPHTNPGYHTRIEAGEWVHPTRDSACYALALLEAGKEENFERAFSIIKSVIPQQDKNPYSASFGIWPWVYEEPLEKMAPPDWNWADFIGAILAMILKGHGEKLPEDLLSETKQSLRFAAWSIFRRNMHPGYTNIAIMGSGVTMAAGELLPDQLLFDYGLQRLRTFIEYTLDQGGLNEFNSPCYTFVALHEVEKILQVVENEEARKEAEKLRRMIWEKLAMHFHVPTGQLSGPHSRSYADYLSSGAVDFLNETTGANIQIHPSISNAGGINESVKYLPCPEEFANAFKVDDKEEKFFQEQFKKVKDDVSKNISGSTWMKGDVCLGSTNQSCMWTQIRPLIAYWKTDKDPAVNLRLRLYKNGKDFASGGMVSVQKNNKVLTGIRMYSDRGDYHIGIDRPESGVFKAESITVSYELTGADSAVEKLSDNTFSFSAGNYQAIVTVNENADFNGNPVVWKIHNENGKAILEGICYQGPVCDFVFDDNFKVNIALGLEIIEEGEQIEDKKVTVEPATDNKIIANFGDLELSYINSSISLD